MRSAARSSPVGEFRNFRRAGVLWKRSRTSTVVPRARAANPRSTTSPPSTRTNAPASAASGRESSFNRLLAAEAERAQLIQLLDARQLARGVALERQLELVGRDPRAVVGDAERRIER